MARGAEPGVGNDGSLRGWVDRRNGHHVQPNDGADVDDNAAVDQVVEGQLAAVKDSKDIDFDSIYENIIIKFIIKLLLSWF